MDVITPFRNDPLEHRHDDVDSPDDAAGARVTGSVQPERVRRVQRQRRELRIRRDGPLPDVDHDAATCDDHHCRAHWRDITTTVYDRTTGRLTA